MASATAGRALPRAQRFPRKKRSYRELDSDEELSDVSPIQSRTPAVRSSNRVQRQNYKEEDYSSDGSRATSDFDLAELRESSPLNIQGPHPNDLPRRSQRTASATHGKRRASPEFTTSGRGLVSRKRVKLSNTSRSGDGSESEKPVLQEQLSVGQTIPHWQDLEYQILLQIFKYAAYPLYVGPSHARPTIQWLLDVSCLSKSFRAAALAALLHSPPVYPVQRAHGLLYLLRHDQDELSTNYRSKIREINIEARNLLMKKSGIVLQELVGRLTPLLSVLNIYHNYDLIWPTTWSQPSTSKKNWAYPLGLFDALDDADIRLRGFSWNGRFPDTKQVLERMPSLNQRSCLSGLHSLSLLNLTLPERSSDSENEGLLITALSSLPELSQLAFENCGMLNETLLTRMPDNLRRLTVTNCANVTSHGLSAFLQAHGHELRGLHLRGNQAMDLGYVCCLNS